MLKNINRLVVVLLFLTASSAYTQTHIKGKVRDKQSYPIMGASVKIKTDSAGVKTDSLGNFSFRTSLKGDIVLVASASGYRSDSLAVHLDKPMIYWSSFLDRDELQLEGVQIRSRKLFTGVNLDLTQTPITAAMAPGAAADPVAALQTFPGAAPAGNETGFFVRGGSAAETAVMFDGLLVKNAFGSKLPDLSNRSRFSVFLFDRTHFTTNGYSAVYGQALSSVLSMETKGLPAKSSTEFALINLGMGVARTERFKNSSLTVGANYYNFKGYHEVVRQYTQWQKDPLQYQMSLSYKHKTSKSGTLKVFMDYSDTDLSFDILNPNDMANDLLLNQNKNLYVNTNYQDFLSKKWKMYAGLGYNRTKEQGDIGGSPYFQTDDIWQQKLMFTGQLAKQLSLRLGAEYFQNERQEGLRTMKRGYKDHLSAAFTEGEVLISEQIGLNAGLRTEYSQYMNKWSWSPRLSVVYSPNTDHHLTASYGIYAQKPEDSFLAETADLNFERNEQFALDYERKMGYRLVKVSVFQKQYRRLTEISTPVFSGFQAYGPPLEVLGFSQNGSGKAKGVDVFFKDETSLKLTDFSVSYSYLDTKRKYLDYPDFGRPAFAPAHTFNFVLQKVNAKVDWTVAATYTYSTGRTYFNPLNPVFMGDHTKDFHNLSVSVTHLPRWLKGFSTFNLNVNNILGFNNVYGYRYAFEGAQRVTVYPPARRSILLSFLMNLDGDDFNR